MLTKLGLAHGDALETMLVAFDDDPSELHGYFCDRSWPIERIVDTLDAWSRGEQLPENWVPCTTWFWEADGFLQGVINVRHELPLWGGHIGYSVARNHRQKGVAGAMLAAVLPRCRDLGIAEAQLIIDADNDASRRTIERNGGVRHGEEMAGDPPTLHWLYSIDLTR